MLYNSFRYLQGVRNISSYEQRKPIDTALSESLPYTNYTDVGWYTTRYHVKGEELLYYYGNDWYNYRNLPPQGNCTGEGEIVCEEGHDGSCRQRQLESSDCIDHALQFYNNTLQWWYIDSPKYYHRICMTHIGIGKSTIEHAGRGVYAKKSFMQGELITVSPVAVITRTHMDEIAYDSLLMNYCLWNRYADIVLVPIGRAAMMNHQPGRHANVAMQWFSWYVADDAMTTWERVRNYSVEELLSSTVQPLDIAFYASRD